jgi:hypothetical protein
MDEGQVDRRRLVFFSGKDISSKLFKGYWITAHKELEKEISTDHVILLSGSTPPSNTIIIDHTS